MGLAFGTRQGNKSERGFDPENYKNYYGNTDGTLYSGVQVEEETESELNKTAYAISGYARSADPSRVEVL